ncbi:hypothetical protein [Spirosoma utsteinense]|uniref:Uncharacterized protein n=1 Tax=Spirosoma utsteinense TaxID=2585773 RepID=A0ABR6WC50_9BACT|nr:hypothetical protein [Spirosoma utsteinense]MBC3783894.1 hypothetical protein [Spirosoma utsteinense]MBC3793525.1 hypothetical protein [Spirosoma utsteinense]
MPRRTNAQWQGKAGGDFASHTCRGQSIGYDNSGQTPAGVFKNSLLDSWFWD